MTNLEAYFGVLEDECYRDGTSLSCNTAELWMKEKEYAEICKFAKCEECRKKSIAWLLSEYEPPELENGDSLKPGQIIEVNNVDGYWIARQFLAYYNGLFWCLQEDKKALAWKRARLPEKEEC